MKKIAIALMCVLLSLGGARAQETQEEMAAFRTWALTPPMGWNSWDCYYSSVTEKEVMQNAQYLVDNDLVKYGWEYVVVDIRWYCNHPSLGGGNYNQRGDQDYVLDEYGRYLPSPTRFPSCMVDGKNVVHRNGLHRDNTVANVLILDPSATGKRCGHRGRRKGVCLVDCSGEIMEAYPSVQAASAATGISRKTIRKHCNGGSVWLLSNGGRFCWDVERGLYGST
jgi:hypothetical protein